MDINVMLIGLGPFSKRSYIKYLKEEKITPKILVDLESNYEYVKLFLKENKLSDTKIWTLPDKYKEEELLPSKYEKELKTLCSKLNITHIINSTEPRAHNMYLNFALKNNINILSDKPITVVRGMSEIENIEKVRNQYYELLKSYENCTCSCKIMCQREYNKGYNYIKKLLASIIKEYNVPITYIDIYTCDGRWEMPHDMFRENHPYKYGYGKLYHSGYHFIDLLAELLQLNNLTTDDKRITQGTLYGNVFTPNDEKVIFNNANFKQIFKDNKLDTIYDNLDTINFKNYGERNFYSQLNFTNATNNLITTVNLNLLKFGVSRRSWIDSTDENETYGKIRHERVNIQVGPLLNIQIHSYQSKEKKDRTNDLSEIEAGGLDHFDIEIYRNVDIIGGIPFEKIKLKDLYETNDDFISFNECGRKEFLNNFLKNKNTTGDLKEHKLGIEILYSASKILYDKLNNKIQIEKINIPK